MKLIKGMFDEELNYYRNMAIVTQDDFNDAFIDDFGVTYSKDGKRLLKGVEVSDYIVIDGTEVICDYAFADIAIRNIQFPKSLKYIGIKACNSCSNYTLPNGLLGIGDEAFSFTETNDQLKIPDSVVFVGKNAFCGAWIMDEVIIGNGLKRIEEGTFQCVKTNSVVIGSSVKYLGNLAFGDNHFDKIVIPKSVKKIEGNPFGNNIKRIISLSNAFVVKNNILYSKDGKKLICCFSKAKKVVVPNTVVEVHSFAFTNSKVENVTLPNSVKTIGWGAFYGAKTKVIRLPNRLKTISKMTFYDSHIEAIIIPNSVKKIELEAFKGCKSLKSVQMSDNVKEIEDGAFGYCFELEEINLPKKLKAMGKKVFFCCYKLKECEDELGINIDK